MKLRVRVYRLTSQNKIVVFLATFYLVAVFIGMLLAEKGTMSRGVVHGSHKITIPFETVSGHINAKNGFAWKYRYRVGLSQESVIVKVAIHLVPAEGVSRVRLNRVKACWEETIEKVWSKKFGIKTRGKIYPIVIDVSFKGYQCDHDVVVRQGKSGTDQLNWGIMDSPELIAHEFGHMLGEYDEYPSGGLNPGSPIIDKTSIMWRYPGKKSKTYQRHYKQFFQWFIEKTGVMDASLVKLEPKVPRMKTAHMSVSGIWK